MTFLNPLQTAQALLDNNIIELSPNKPFTFASGIKSPIYCDGRKIISNPTLRSDIAYSLAQKIKEQYPEVEVISGVATGSIAMAAWVAQILELPMIYYRKPKGYGHNNTIEGQFLPRQKVVVIEDTVSTGGSCLNAVKSLRESDLDVLGVAFIYTHQMKSSITNFEINNCPFVYLAGLSQVVECASNSGVINQKEIEMIKKWQIDSQNWMN